MRGELDLKILIYPLTLKSRQTTQVKVTNFCIKFDFLGLKTLSVIQHACMLIKQRHGIDIDPDKLDFNDKKTYALFSSGDTDGVFQVESDGMKQMLRSLKPRDFAAITAAIALYRPGPMAYIPSYVANYNGVKEPEYVVPELEPILKETYGIIVYQEQVMRIAQDLAGYSPGKADALRKAMGKKIESIMNKEIQKLIYGSKEDNIPGLIAKDMKEEVAIKLGEDIKEFAKYAFERHCSEVY